MRLKRASGASYVLPKAALIAAVVVVVFGLGVYYLLAAAPQKQGASSITETSCAQPSQGTSLLMYSADAYTAESTTLERAFSCASGVPMVAPPTSGGSLTLGREIAQGRPVSVFLSVSKAAVQETILGATFGGWAVSFATDQMSIVYSNSSSHSGTETTVIDSYRRALSTNATADWRNFFDNLTSGSVKVGISDPNSDPAGYRAWLVLEAAGYLYANGDANYFASRMLAFKGNITGASAADLIPPLEAGNIQFLFIYRSAAKAQGLNLVQLPDGINFGNPADASLYSKFSYSTSTGVVETGGTIALWLAVPSDSTDNADAVAFVSFVVQNSPTLLKGYGLESISPAELYNDTAVPGSIQQLLTQGLLVHAGAL